MKLKKLLNEVINEVGEGTSKPFEFKFLGRQGDVFGWYIEGKDENNEAVDVILEVTIYTEYMDDEGGGVPLRVFDEVGKNTIKSAEVNFRITDEHNTPGIGYIEVNDRIYMYRLMATLKRILLPFVQENDIDTIEYIPVPKGNTTANSDKGEGRDRLYALFIGKTFPNTKKFTHGDNIYFVLK